MIATISHAYIEKGEEKYLYDFRGLSTDTKPEKPGSNGSTFFEMDTGDLYVYDEDNETWIAVGS